MPRMESELSKNIIALLKETHTTVYELSKQIKLQQSVITRIVNGDTLNPNIATIQKIASFFNVTISQLFGEVRLSENRISGEITSNLELNSIPLLDWNEIEDWLKNKSSFPVKSHIKTELSEDHDSSLFSVKVLDSSLEPRYFKGTTLILDSQRKAKNKDVVLISNNSPTPVLKRILIEGNDSYLKSLNIELADIPPVPKKDDDVIISIVIQARITY